MSEGFVLGLDSSGPVVGMALWREGAPLRWLEERRARGADEWLLPALAAFVEGVELERIAVVNGPGSFTGLRVGVAAALGLAMARDLRVVPMNALLCRAAAVQGERVLALLDARKGRVYAGLYRVQGERVDALGPAVDAPLAAVLPAPPFRAVGEGALVHREAILAAGGEVVEGAAASGAVAAARRASVEPGVDPTALSLCYLREADAIVPAGLGRRHGWAEPG